MGTGPGARGKVPAVIDMSDHVVGHAPRTRSTLVAITVGGTLALVMLAVAECVAFPFGVLTKVAIVVVCLCCAAGLIWYMRTWLNQRVIVTPRTVTITRSLGMRPLDVARDRVTGAEAARQVIGPGMRRRTVWSPVLVMADGSRLPVPAGSSTSQSTVQEFTARLQRALAGTSGTSS